MDAVGALSTLVTGAELVSKTGKVKYLWNKYLRGRTRVLVYGDSGVGKSQFLNTLTGNNAYVTQRTRMNEKYILTLASGRVIEFIDTPGHQTASVIRKTALDYLTKGKIDGIINLVNYGYQDSEELQSHPEKVFNVDTKEVKSSFLNDNRKLEIARTEEFLDRLTPGVHLNWIITVVNKADIWFANKKDVYEYYTEGEYGQKLASLIHSVKLYTAPFCSVITPFANREMKLIFSERDKKQMFDTLTHHLDTLI